MKRIPARFCATLLKSNKVETLPFFPIFKPHNIFKYAYSKVLIGFMMLNLLFGLTTNLKAQSPSPSAMLEVASNNKGVLFPQVSLTSTSDVTTINAPAVSLMVYNPASAGTYPYNVMPGFYYWSGVRWIPLSGSSAFSEFYALMPPDNAATIAAGTAINFPQNGRSNGVIIRSNDTQFLLPDVGTYQVNWQVSIGEAGQLGLQLNGTLIANTVVGRATGTSQIVGNTIITTTIPNSLLSVLNPAGNTPALTITPTAGGTHAVTANLVITRIQ
jgi:BclA C-terminal domain